MPGRRLFLLVVMLLVAVCSAVKPRSHTTCGQKAAVKLSRASTSRHRAYAEGTLRLLKGHAAKKRLVRAPQAPVRHGRDLSASTSTIPAAIRFQMDYQISNLGSEQQQLVKDVSSAAIAVLQQYIKVKEPVSGRLLVSPLCVLSRQPEGVCLKAYPDFSSGAAPQLCGLATLRRDMFGSLPMEGGSATPGGPGVATDYYMLVTSQQDSKCSSANAWAAHCFQDLETGRPLLGTVNICPDRLTSGSGSPLQQLVPTLLHELFHAIGFSDALFGFYLDEHGNRRSEDQVVRKVTGPFGHKVSRVITPQVVSEARSQFGCPSLEGADLEDEGGDGTSGSHWEYRLFQGDLMCASTQSLLGQSPKVSRLTLALMQDSGWYMPVWEAAGDLDWGRGASCLFATATCGDFAAQRPAQPYFCTAPSQGSQGSSCTADGRAVGSCTTNGFTNGCPVVQAYNDAPNCAVPSTVPQQEASVFGFDSGANSRCTPVSYPMVRRTGNSIYTYPSGSGAGQRDAMCYPMSCTPSGLLMLDILGQQVECPTGEVVDLASHPALTKLGYSSGKVGPCPDNARMCSTMGCPGDCGLQGECREGQCSCSLTTTGSDCSTPLAGIAPMAEMPDAPLSSPLRVPNNAVVKVDVLVNATSNEFGQLQSSFMAELAKLAGVLVSTVRLVSAYEVGDGTRAVTASTSPVLRVTAWVGVGLRSSEVLSAYQQLLGASTNKTSLARSFLAAGLHVAADSFQVALIAGESSSEHENLSKMINRQTSSIGGVAGLAGIIAGGVAILVAAGALTCYLTSATRRPKRPHRRPTHRGGPGIAPHIAAQHSHSAAQHGEGNGSAGHAATRATLGPRVADALYVASGLSPRGSPRSPARRLHHASRAEQPGGQLV